jgi:hypothetical protein
MRVTIHRRSYHDGTITVDNPCYRDLTIAADVSCCDRITLTHQLKVVIDIHSPRIAAVKIAHLPNFNHGVSKRIASKIRLSSAGNDAGPHTRIHIRQPYT